ncbi:hypothetical protein [Agriterribacter sp.]|uniref:hypothetical protein n=1 Tax=Agriterribacter sp. TaxID=2821509 RepID=UPI002BE58E7F|nr:hypothetical protein [Agriterribacter sp.]HRP54782.1 hypothetical protein [Agriterribacter sp.]
MIILKLEQLLFESDTWKRALTFMTEENIRLKSRLSEILQKKIDKALLPRAEEFNSSFLKHDDLIKVLRNDISRFDKLLTREQFEEGSVIIVVESGLEIIRKNIKEAKERFSALQLDFYNQMRFPS